MGNEPKKKRKNEAEEQAGNDRKVERGVFATVHDVARQFSRAEGELVPEVKKDADQHQKCSKEDKRAPEIAKRLHRGILPEALGKSF